MQGIDWDRVRRLLLFLVLKLAAFSVLSWLSYILALSISISLPIPRTVVDMSAEDKFHLLSKNLQLCGESALRSCMSGNQAAHALDINRMIDSAVDRYFDEKESVLDRIVLKSNKAAERARRSVARSGIIFDFRRCAGLVSEQYGKIAVRSAGETTAREVYAGGIRGYPDGGGCLYAHDVVQSSLADYRSVGFDGVRVASDLAVITDKLYSSDGSVRGQDGILIKLGQVEGILGNSDEIEEICGGSPAKDCRARLRNIRQMVSAALSLMQASPNPSAVVELRQLMEVFWANVVFYTLLLILICAMIYTSLGNIVEIFSMLVSGIWAKGQP